MIFENAKKLQAYQSEDEKQVMLLYALWTQVSIHKSIDTLENIGLLVEPDSEKSGSIANHLYNALSANSKVICKLMNMSDDIARYEAFGDAVSDYSRQFPDLTINDVKKHFFETKYGEIRYDFMDGNEPVSVDAWFTEDDNEEGHVIAQIDQQTKRVKYLDNDASYDPYAQEIIHTVIRLLELPSEKVSFKSRG